MSKAKFNVGDDIVLKEYHGGFAGGRILKVDDRYYQIKIIRGVAQIPIKSIDENYKLKNQD